jgi:hypothetical protein
MRLGPPDAEPLVDHLQDYLPRESWIPTVAEALRCPGLADVLRWALRWDSGPKTIATTTLSQWVGALAALNAEEEEEGDK